MSEQRSIRERAAAAMAEEQARLAASQEEYQRSQGPKLAGLLRDVLGLEVQPDSDQVEIEGVLFAIRWEDRHSYLVIRQPCPDCGQQLTSWPIQSWVNVGQVLAGVGAFEWHDCSGRRCHTAADLLRDALRAFLGLEVDP